MSVNLTSSQDTIAAIATAFGEAAIAIVKISGKRAVEIADKIFKSQKGLKEIPPRYMQYGWIIDENGQKIGEVMVVKFKAPKSYTGEDVVEIQCHGGVLIAQKILDLVLKQGARLAEPGEFTLRAFLNGRIDLTQAESVIAIIRARSEEAIKGASRILQGTLSKKAKKIREDFLSLIAQIEVGLDFPDEDVPYITNEEIKDACSSLKETLHSLLSKMEVGNLFRQGVKIAILGKPNVGKSSLLNALLSEARAIVTSIPGTTRDIIEEVVSYKGLPIRLIDTAGIRESGDLVESIGIKKALSALKEADLRLFVLDISSPLTEEDKKIAQELKGKNFILVLNKCDLRAKWDVKEAFSLLNIPKCPHIKISATKNINIEELKELIYKTCIGKQLVSTEILSATKRQINHVKKALEHIERAIEAVSLNISHDIIASELSLALSQINSLMGIEITDEIINKIFSEFCVGK